ncbi:hypothetical protein TNIN_273701 [Trichonephila inaurata madagascariensis]|uniref:Uncharacterized protein n=1 Tax=Trichonephila inaurata madagascariensis TaxID=2747483 RepID=A0A8X7CMF0_9ARAC|nr:hypothetical protein TNIN_273701 [Trichonephila inaurata madagascariensis]
MADRIIRLVGFCQWPHNLSANSYTPMFGPLRSANMQPIRECASVTHYGKHSRLSVGFLRPKRGQHCVQKDRTESTNKFSWYLNGHRTIKIFSHLVACKLFP